MRSSGKRVVLCCDPRSAHGVVDSACTVRLPTPGLIRCARPETLSIYKRIVWRYESWFDSSLGNLMWTKKSDLNVFVDLLRSPLDSALQMPVNGKRIAQYKELASFMNSIITVSKHSTATYNTSAYLHWYHVGTYWIYNVGVFLLVSAIQQRLNLAA